MDHGFRHKLIKLMVRLLLLAGLGYVIYRSSRPTQTGRRRIDDLVNRSRKELDAIFLAGKTPTIQEMNGIVDGNVLSGVYILNTQFFKNFLNLGWFIWRGKVFENRSDYEGKGINRFKVGPLKFLQFHCETKISPPLVGNTNVFNLNYDLPGNPWFIRQIRDDIRKIDDGLYLGSANFMVLGKHRFLVYFILESAK